MNASDCPPMPTIRRVARRQGLRVRKSQSGSHLLWLVDGDDRIVSPLRGLPADEMWQLVQRLDAEGWTGFLE
jgi:hypothetical protein